jgi:tetratricopeptide (TPR) repeat protein
MLIGLARLRTLDVAGAIAEFEAVNRLNPKIAQNHHHLARARLASGDVEGARREYAIALELAPQSTQLRLELARLSTDKPDPALATARIQELTAAVGREPANAALRDALAQAYLFSGRYAEAEAEYRRILDGAPAFVSANRGMAVLRFRQNRPDEAVGFLQAVLRVDPADVAANMGLADHHEARGQTERAIAHLEAVRRTNPKLVAITLRLGRLYGRAGRVAEGMARTKEVLTVEPRSALAHITLGGLLLQTGDIASAIQALNTATRLDPGLPLAHFTLGNAHEQKGDIPAAVDAYRRAIAVAPNSAEAHNNIAWIYASQGQNLDEALALARKAHDLAPEHPGILDTLGFVHYRRAEYQQAERVLKKATELASTDATAFYHLGLTYQRLGRPDDAAFALRRSLQLRPAGPHTAEIRAALEELRK